MENKEVTLTEEERVRKEILDALVVTEAIIDDIEKAPQRSQKWKDARGDGRFTVSNFGAAAGHNPHCSLKQLTKQVVWSLFTGNAATQYGTDMEAPTRNNYFRFKQKQHAEQNKTSTLSIYEPGLILCLNELYNRFGFSADAFVYEHETADDKHPSLLLGEIKVPARKGFYGKIPLYYYDQIQGQMFLKKYYSDLKGYKDIPQCDFIVATPEYTCIQTYEYNAKYVHEILLPKVMIWYNNYYLPALVLKRMGKLAHGEIEPVVRLDSYFRIENDVNASTTTTATAVTATSKRNVDDDKDTTCVSTSNPFSMPTTKPKTLAPTNPFSMPSKRPLNTGVSPFLMPASKRVKQ